MEVRQNIAAMLLEHLDYANALGHYEETDYDKAGHVTEVRRYDATPSPDVLVQRSTRYYDERGRHWKTSDLFKDPSTTYSDAVTQIERWKSGRVRYVTDPRSEVAETQYDNAWRVTKTIDAAELVEVCLPCWCRR